MPLNQRSYTWLHSISSAVETVAAAHAACTAGCALSAPEHRLPMMQELDEAEVEEARRRRQQYENDDSEMCARPAAAPSHAEGYKWG